MQSECSAAIRGALPVKPVLSVASLSSLASKALPVRVCDAAVLRSHNLQRQLGEMYMLLRLALSHSCSCVFPPVIPMGRMNGNKALPISPESVSVVPMPSADFSGRQQILEVHRR